MSEIATVIILVLLPYFLGFAWLQGTRSLIIFALFMLVIAIVLPMAFNVSQWEEDSLKYHGSVWAQGAMAALAILLVGGGVSCILMKGIILRLPITKDWQKAMLFFIGIVFIIPIGFLYILSWEMIF